jgi:hypothetical protein
VYAYARPNPVSWKDPAGLVEEPEREEPVTVKVAVGDKPSISVSRYGDELSVSKNSWSLTLLGQKVTGLKDQVSARIRIWFAQVDFRKGGSVSSSQPFKLKGSKLGGAGFSTSFDPHGKPTESSVGIGPSTVSISSSAATSVEFLGSSFTADPAHATQDAKLDLRYKILGGIAEGGRSLGVRSPVDTGHGRSTNEDLPAQARHGALDDVLGAQELK